MNHRHHPHNNYKNATLCTLDEFPRLRMKDIKPMLKAAKRFADLVNGTGVDVNTDDFTQLWRNRVGQLSVHVDDWGLVHKLSLLHNGNNNDLCAEFLEVVWVDPHTNVKRAQRFRLVRHPSNLPNRPPYMYFTTNDDGTGRLFRTLYISPDGVLFPRPCITNGRYKIQRLTPYQKGLHLLFNVPQPFKKRRKMFYQGKRTPYGTKVFKWMDRTNMVLYGEPFTGVFGKRKPSKI